MSSDGSLASDHQVKIAIIGAGLMGKWHAHYAKRLGAEISAVIDNDLAAARVLAQQHGAEAYTDLALAMKGEEFKVLHVCTPAPTHVQFIKQALRADKHVIVEKPLAEHLNDVISLTELAKAVKKNLCPVHQFPFQAGVSRLKKELSIRGGDVLHVAFDISSAGAAGSSPEEMNQVLVEILPHPLSIMAEVWGRDIIDSNVEMWKVDNPRAGELHVYGQYAPFPIAIRLSMNARPTECKMTVYHEQGTIHIDLFHGFAVMESARVSRLHKLLKPFAYSLKMIWCAGTNLIERMFRRELAYPGLEQLIKKFYISVEETQPSPISVDNYFFVTKVAEHIKRRISF